MNRRFVSLLILVMLTALPGFSSPDQFHAQNRSKASAEQISHARRMGLFRANLQPKTERASARRATRMQSQQLIPGPLATSFISAVQISAGGSPNSPFPSVTGDFNGDGHMDVATVVNYNTSHVPMYAISVVLSNGDGTFQTPVLTKIANAEFDPIWVGNLDGVNGDDIIIGHQATSTTPASVDVWLNGGTGTFTLKGTFPVTTVNGDNIVWSTLTPHTAGGNLDFVVADAATPNGSVWTLLGNGDGTFQSPTSVQFAGAIGPVPVAFADFNHDGFLDFAATTASNNQVMVYINNGAGGYNAPVPLSTPDSVYDGCYITTGDLHGDNTHPDIAVANCPDNNLTVYVNDGTGNFPKNNYYDAGRVPEGLAIADVNGDGKNDIVAADGFGGDVSILLGNGDGTLQTPTVGYAAGGYPGGNPFSFVSSYPTVPPLVADFNGDGHLDVIVADSLFSFAFLSGYGDGSFRSAIDSYAPVGLKNPFSVGMASGDFNGDGITDYVIGNSKSYSGSRTGVTVFLGNSDGGLQTGVPHGGEATNGILSHVAVSDFNKDGILDVVASDLANGGVQIFTGNGDGTFQTGNTYAGDTQTTYSSTSVVAGDFNKDGYPDIAVVNTYNSGANFDVGVLINDKQGGFKPVVNYSLNATSQVGAAQINAELTAADLNNDGKTDLLVPNFGTQSAPGAAVAVLYGNGDGTFQAESDVTVSTNPFYVAVGDFNGDGIPDMAVSSDDGPSNFQGIDIVLQSPLGTFTLAHQYQSTAQDTTLHVPVPTFIRLADVNGDGFMDLVYTNSNFGTVGVLYGDGTGKFPNGPFEYPAGGNAYNLLLADVNHGGALDVVTGDGNASELTVMLDTTSAPNVLTSSGSPSIAGLSVTFTANVSAVRGVSGVPSGTVTFYDGAISVGGPVALSSGVATFNSNRLTGGSHSVTAHYSGDANFSASTSAAFQQSITKAIDSTAVASSMNPSGSGQEVTFTATATNMASGSVFVPTGGVTFFDGTTSLGLANLNSKGVATLSISSLAVGSHNITSQYGGDVNFPGSTSPELNQVVAMPDYELAADPLSQNVNPGSSAQFTITLSPLSGYNGTVKFTCPAKLPTGVTCTLPKPVQVSGNKPIKATLTINTTGPSGALIAPQDLHRREGDTNLWASLTGFGIIGLVVAGDWKKRNRRRIAIGLAVLALVMILALAGCGSGQSSGSGSGGGTGGTPAGNYQVQVTATGTAGTNGGNTSPHPVTATINVQ